MFVARTLKLGVEYAAMTVSDVNVVNSIVLQQLGLKSVGYNTLSSLNIWMKRGFTRLIKLQILLVNNVLSKKEVKK